MEFEIVDLKNELIELNKELENMSSYKMIGIEVNHKKFGVGKIISQKGFNITIKFADKDRDLQFPFIFINNIVECNNEELLGKMNDLYELQNSIVSVEKKLKELELLLNKEACSNLDSNPNLFAVTTGISFDDVINTNIYYCKAYRCRKNCEYLGLYNNKAITKIGKVKKIIEAKLNNDILITDLIYGEPIIEEDIEHIKNCIERGFKLFNCNIGAQKHKYFIVDKFYDTNYKKTSSGGLMEHKYFDLCNRLKTEDLPDIEDLAIKLRTIAW